MNVDREGVHLTHCCLKCGCKYCDPDCPVANGWKEAQYECEDCERDREELRNSLQRMSLSELSETIELLSSIYKEKLQENLG